MILCEQVPDAGAARLNSDTSRAGSVRCVFTLNKQENVHAEEFLSLETVPFWARQALWLLLHLCVTPPHHQSRCYLTQWMSLPSDFLHPHTDVTPPLLRLTCCPPPPWCTAAAKPLWPNSSYLLSPSSAPIADSNWL